MVLTKDAAISRCELQTETKHPIRLDGSTLDHRAHVCAFFNTPDEAFQALLPYIKEGLELGHKNVHTIDPRLRADHCQRLASAGIKLDAAFQSDQLELLDWSSTHLRESKFDQHKTSSRYRHMMADATQKGFPLTRFVTDMGWALEAELEANALLEYESTANYEWMHEAGTVHPVICTYDLRLFTADIIVDVMRTHPMVMIGGVLRENPFFVPPGEFLEQLRGRKPSKVEEGGAGLNSGGAKTMGTSGDVEGLKACLNDLIGILTLPALWTGREQDHVIRTLIDAVCRTLQLDFVYARLNLPNGKRLERIRITGSGDGIKDNDDLRQALRQWLRDDPKSRPTALSGLHGDNELALAAFSLGTDEHTGGIRRRFRSIRLPNQVRAASSSCCCESGGDRATGSSTAERAAQNRSRTRL
jgi:MEDS: MEthanogen/methylotroph, DcmR Sensory domain